MALGKGLPCKKSLDLALLPAYARVSESPGHRFGPSLVGWRALLPRKRFPMKGLGENGAGPQVPCCADLRHGPARLRGQPASVGLLPNADA